MFWLNWYLGICAVLKTVWCVHVDVTDDRTPRLRWNNTSIDILGASIQCTGTVFLYITSPLQKAKCRPFVLPSTSLSTCVCCLTQWFPGMSVIMMEDKSGVGLHKRRTESNGKCVCSSTLCSLAGSGSRHLNCHPHLWFVQRFKQGQFVVPVEGCFHCSEEQMTGRWMRTNGLRLTQLNSKSCFFLNASCSVLVSVTLRDQRNNLNLRKKKTFLLIRHRLMRTKCWPCGTTQHLRFAQNNTVLLCFTFSLNWNLYFFEYAPEYKKKSDSVKIQPFPGRTASLCVFLCMCACSLTFRESPGSSGLCVSTQSQGMC